MSECIWQPRTSAYVIQLLSAVFIQKELLNEWNTEWIHYHQLRCARWSHVGAESVTAWPPTPCRSQKVSSLHHGKSDCKPSSSVCYREELYTLFTMHTFLNDKIVGDDFLSWFLIVFSLRKKTAVERKKKKNKLHGTETNYGSAGFQHLWNTLLRLLLSEALELQKAPFWGSSCSKSLNAAHETQWKPCLRWFIFLQPP